jgi:hypothetical protein
MHSLMRSCVLHICLSAVPVVVVVGDRRPVGGLDFPRMYQEFRSWFPDEWSCREYLAGLRWPRGFSCPGCGSGGCWRTGAGLWMCADCGVEDLGHRRDHLSSLTYAVVSRVADRAPSPTNSLQPGLQAGRQIPELTISFTSPNTHPETATTGDPSQATEATTHTVTDRPSKRYKPLRARA